MDSLEISQEFFLRAVNVEQAFLDGYVELNVYNFNHAILSMHSHSEC